MPAHLQIETIHTREDLVRFLEEFSADYRRDPGSWENHTLDRFLDALTSWVEDMDGFYLNRGEPLPVKPDWKIFAHMLMGAAIYE
jgi:hypothetical protein